MNGSRLSPNTESSVRSSMRSASVKIFNGIKTLFLNKNLDGYVDRISIYYAFNKVSTIYEICRIMYIQQYVVYWTVFRKQFVELILFKQRCGSQSFRTVPYKLPLNINYFLEDILN